MVDKKHDSTQYFLIDFDSTFIKSEGLEELAAITLKNNPKKIELIKKIAEITKQSMEGKLPFDESLKLRLAFIHPTRKDIDNTAALLKKKITTSIARNKQFFKIHKNQIYIISGGFKEFILPVTNIFGIPEDHVYANTFYFDNQDKVSGIDEENPLAQDDGKVKLVRSLGLEGDIFIIGDGYSDYKLKELGLVKKFIAFTENIEREVIIQKADTIASTFDEFLYVNKLPMSLSYPKNRIKVLMLERIDQEAVKIFEDEGYAVSYYQKSMSEEELIEEIKNVSILCVRSRTKITSKVLDAAKYLLAIGVFGIGVNNVDASAAAEKGINIFNAPYSSTRSVAELVIGEIIMLNRRIFEKSSKLHQGIWDKNAQGSKEIKGKTLGIIGYGNIGTQVGILAEALGMHVLFYDFAEKPILGTAKKCSTMEELLKKSDIVTLHVDGRETNKNLITEKEMKNMKTGALLINASRGYVVHISDLVSSVQTKKLSGAAVDVFPIEPKQNNEPFKSELQNLPNVILTPHIGAATEEAQKNIALYVSQKLIAYINTGDTYLSINMPQIQLPEQNNAHRILHLHKNVPGILAKINNIFAENNINIVGQYLKTNETIGYVITDVDKKYDKQVLDIIKEIPDTIRFRVLY
jgi:D-3-phosphoglycerate dehydrogenase